MPGRATLLLSALTVFLITYIGFEIWRPSLLLVGNVTVDVVGNPSQPKRLPGGVPFDSALTHDKRPESSLE